VYPVLFNLDLGRFGKFTIGTYGLFYALGFLLALRLAVGLARREGIDSARIVDLGIVALLAGFVGAKATLYLIDARYYYEHPMEILRNLRSAGVFYGGFALAAAASVLYVRRYRLPLRPWRWVRRSAVSGALRPAVATAGAAIFPGPSSSAIRRLTSSPGSRSACRSTRHRSITPSRIS